MRTFHLSLMRVSPIFEVFYLEDPHGIIADFSGNPPYRF